MLYHVMISEDLDEKGSCSRRCVTHVVISENIELLVFTYVLVHVEYVLNAFLVLKYHSVFEICSVNSVKGSWKRRLMKRQKA